MDADLALVHGADVFLVFIESYGAISFERHDLSLAQPVTGERARLSADIRETGRESCRRSSSRRPSAARRGSRTSA